MKHLFIILLFSFLIIGNSQINAGISFCDVIAVTADGLGKVDGEKKPSEEEEEPECD